MEGKFLFVVRMWSVSGGETKSWKVGKPRKVSSQKGIDCSLTAVDARSLSPLPGLPSGCGNLTWKSHIFRVLERCVIRLSTHPPRQICEKRERNVLSIEYCCEGSALILHYCWARKRKHLTYMITRVALKRVGWRNISCRTSWRLGWWYRDWQGVNHAI